MYNKCCVVNCGSRRKDVILHNFPTTEIGLQTWLKCLSAHVSVNLQELSTVELRKLFVCHKHFEKKFTTCKQRLHIGAHPTLFSINEITAGIPTGADCDTEITNLQKDHGYSRKRKHDDHSYSKSVSENIPSTSHAIVQMPAPIIAEVVPSTSCAIEELCTSTSTLKTQTEAQAKVMPSTSGAMVQTSGLNPHCSGPVTLNVTPRRHSRRCLFKNIKSLTPNCHRIYKEYNKSRKQLNFNRRARRAIKFNANNAFDKLAKRMNPLAKKIFWLQVKQCTKNSKGRRFTLDEKIIGLSIMKQSPKCYKFLQKIFILPSKTTLNKMISNLYIEAGINPQIFLAIKKEVDTWMPNKKICTIIFDEVALEPAVHYNKHKDAITGFVEVGETKTNDFADHALVFMIRGALYKWQQPLAFYFCKGATSSGQLKTIINDIVIAVSDSGLTPIALVSDQGTAFRSALKSLQEDTKREQLQAGDSVIDDIIIIKGHILSVIFDPPHLLKGLRNNFLTKNIRCDGKVSKWEDIVEIYKRDCNHAQMRLLPKLNDEHVIPEKIKKMKVKNCARVFSKSVAATLTYTAGFAHYADGTEVSSTLKNTAEIVSFFDDMFDSVNGAAIFSKSSKGKPLRKAVTANSVHHAFWKDALRKLKKIKFIDSNGKETVVPSLKNWIVTIESYQRVWQFFKSKNIKIMRPRYFNSDPIENFFGQVRAYNLRNNDPDCHTFQCTFKSLLITRFIKFHSTSFNCEDDSGDQLLKIKSLFETNVLHEEVDKPEQACNRQQNFDPESLLLSVRQERLNVHSRAYTAGWVVRQTLNKVKCDLCEKNLTSQVEEPIHKWISFREFTSIKKRKLSYPTEHALRFFSKVIEEANKYLEYEPHRDKILENIKNAVLSGYTFDFLECEEHKNIVQNHFLGFAITLAVFNWCNVINRILKGTDVSRLENKKLPPMQYKAFDKYKKKLKNKRINK